MKFSDRTDPQLHAAQNNSMKWQEQELISKMAAAKVIEDEMYPEILILKFLDMPRGQRLTPQRQKDIKLNAELLPTERDIFFRVLSNREAALAWDFSEMSRIRPEEDYLESWQTAKQISKTYLAKAQRTHNAIERAETQWGQRLVETAFPLGVFETSEDYTKAINRLITLANGFPDLIKTAIIGAITKRI